MSRLVFSPGAHRYHLDGTLIEGVTTAISDGLPKPALAPWAANAAADYVVDHWTELAELGPSAKIAKIKRAPWEARDRAAVRGTKVHGYGVDLVYGREVAIPEEYVGPAEAYAKFLDAWEITPVATETPLAHTEHRYGGTSDLWASIGRRDGERALFDLKTGRDVYPDVCLQIAAYRYADLWQPDGPGSENTDVPEVAATYVAHILPDTVRLVPVTAGPAEFRAFLYVLQTARWVGRHSKSFKAEDGSYRPRLPLVGQEISA